MPRRPDWSRPLPRPLTIPEVMEVATLADVRKLIDHLPKQSRAKANWRYVEVRLVEAAGGGSDTIHVSVPLQMVLTMEGVAWQSR